MSHQTVFRVLLRCYPEQFRQRHGRDLLSFWTRQSGEARYAGRAGRLLFWSHVFRDAVLGGLRSRLAILARARSGGVPSTMDSRGKGTFAQDLRQAVRSIRGAPIHALVVALTLGLGIGATTAILGVVDTVLLRPLPYADASELVSITRVEEDDGANISWPDFRDWRAQAPGFAGMAAYYEAAGDFRWDDSAEQLVGAGVTRDLFELLGVAPLLGRTFTSDEDRLDGTDAIILSWGLWQRRFGGDPGAVGSIATVGGEPVEIVGVMPRSFAFPLPTTQYWQPLQDDELLQNAGLPTGRRTLVFLDVVARLDGSLERAQTGLSALAARIWDAEDIAQERRLPVRVRTLRDRLVGDVRGTLVMFLGAVALVLLVACANVASLALSRATARKQELAVRAALGAGRRRLVRQLLTESLVLASVGGVLGIGVAWATTRFVVATAPAGVPRLAGATTGPITLVFAAVLSLVSGLLFGVVPAWQSTRSDVTGGLARRGRGRGSDRRTLRLQQMLAMFQVALSVALLTGAVLLVRSYVRLMSVEPGYSTEGVVTAAISPPEDLYAEPAKIDAFYTTLLDRVRALPGVVAATTTYSPPLAGNGFRTTIEIEGRPEVDEDRIWAGSVVVRDGYFETTGTPLVAGRDFGPADRLGGEPVAIVNRSLANRFWPGEDAIGKRFRLTRAISGSIGRYDRAFFPADWFTVVGIAGDVRREGLDLPPEPEYYRAHRQIPWAFEYLVVRILGEADDLGRQIRAAVRSTDTAVPIDQIRTVRSTVLEAAAEWRFRMQLLSGFGLSTCLLAMLGVYAVMALAVARRQRELGVRLALGATGADLLRQTLGRGLRLVGAGAATGLALAAFATRVLRSMLYDVAPSDPITHVAVIAATTAVALLACWLPAKRASRIDPIQSLQQE